jgi:hypothetical protein
LLLCSSIIAFIPTESNSPSSFRCISTSSIL